MLKIPNKFFIVVLFKIVAQRCWLSAVFKTSNTLSVGLKRLTVSVQGLPVTRKNIWVALQERKYVYQVRGHKKKSSPPIRQGRW
tara:strand:+ start:214 stop:465 length:252 start_codon:yes stop_codon:yes gene_type:complete